MKTIDLTDAMPIQSDLDILGLEWRYKVALRLGLDKQTALAYAQDRVGIVFHPVIPVEYRP